MFCLKANFASGDLCLISIHQYAANVVMGSDGAIMALHDISVHYMTVTSDMTSCVISDMLSSHCALQ